MKKIMIIFLFSLILVGSAFAQESNFAVHISNPLGLFQKAGAKLEFKTGRIGVLLTGTKYFGRLPKYSGEKKGAELRLYSKIKEQEKHEKFLYMKVNVGHVDYFAGSGDGFTSFNAIPESNYYGIATGLGRHLNFNQLFIDINAGFQYAVPEVKQDAAFYITGPGSFLDLHLNLGFQF